MGEPLYLDVVAALKDRKDIEIIGGRYGWDPRIRSQAT